MNIPLWAACLLCFLSCLLGSLLGRRIRMALCRQHLWNHTLDMTEKTYCARCGRAWIDFIKKG
jgi:hypothetical protein